MLAQHFVAWCETANTSERCAGVMLLTDAVAGGKFLPKDARQAEAALVFALDDPSPRVRRTIAEGVAASDRVSRQLVRALSADIDEIAVLVAGRSPVLELQDLVDIVAAATSSVRTAIARRTDLPEAVASALVDTGDAVACAQLARNDEARIDAGTMRRLAERFAGNGEVRHALLQRDDLPADVRHALLLSLGEMFCASPFVSTVVGFDRAARLREEIAEQATAALIDILARADLSPFVEHLRASGQLNAAILIRAVCSGRIDLFASSLARLSGLPEKRVRAVIVDAREPAFMALASAAGLPKSVVPLLLSAVRVWKDVAGEDTIDPVDLAAMVMERVVVSFRRSHDQDGFADLSALLHRLSTETQRFTARKRAERYLAA